MYDALRVPVAACFYYSGLVKLVRWWTLRSGRCLVILNYHRASGGDLRSHWLYLRRHYRLLHLEAALEELNKPCSEVSHKRDQRPLLALTFDDGYYDNYTHSFALARELQVPITIFLIPGSIESGDRFWWLEPDRLVRHTQVGEVSVEGRTYHLDRREERKALIQTIEARLCSATSVTEREAFLTSARQGLAVPSSVSDEERLALPLKWEQVEEMEKSRWVSFGAHTMHHPVLAYLTDPAEVKLEVGECRAVLERQLGHAVRTFAYPLGKPEHIGDNGLHAVQEAGYGWAVTTIPGLNTPRTNPYLLRRLNVGPNQHWLVMAAEATGMWGFFSRLLRDRLAPALKRILNIFGGNV
jgi:peptidoglycan/xylan/chitin deacetylase (PgdA/CDA1 family)